jgi:argininosuccinate lyase
MQQLTVGEDPILDRKLVKFDCIGSAAHAAMLKKIKIISPQELSRCLKGLRKIYADETFTIPYELEDVHTAIENELTTTLGDVGKKIHTARSRNDQVLLAMRLYTRSELITHLHLLSTLFRALILKAKKFGEIPMPGYTHMQPAMPSSIALWLHAYIEGALEAFEEGIFLLQHINKNPLGSAAGFGVSIKIDREYVAKLLGFNGIQRSVIDVNNSRGRTELKVVRWCESVVSLLEKFACDVMLMTTAEFGFASLPKDLSTGSSIMPQKRNPDLVELLRAKGSVVRGAAHELAGVIAKLPSSYHRDLQYTKAPTMRAFDETKNALRMADLIVNGLVFNKEKLTGAMYPELYATYEAFNQVLSGKPFRDAYRDTAQKVESKTLDVKTLQRGFTLIQKQAVQGISAAMKKFTRAQSKLISFEKVVSRSERAVLGGA